MALDSSISNFNESRKHQAKRFALKASLFLPLVLSVASINVLEDPALLFRNESHVNDIAKILLSGKNVVGLVEFNDRKLQKCYIEGLEKPKDVIVLGSSRSLQIHSGMFPHLSFFNHSVSGGTIQDYIAIIELYRERGMKPKVVIITLDPWFLNRNNGQVRWLELKEQYINGLRRLKLEADSSLTEDIRHTLDKYYQLISPSYLQASVKLICDGRRGQSAHRPYWASDQPINDIPTRRFDGALSYSVAMRNRSLERIDREARNAANMAHDPDEQELYGYDQFEELDPELMRHLSHFVAALKAQDIQVILFLPPYHPIFYEALVTSKYSKMTYAAQQYFEALAREHDIPIVGSFNPRDRSCGPEDFYDHMHPQPSCVEKLFQQARIGSKKLNLPDR